MKGYVPFVVVGEFGGPVVVIVSVEVVWPLVIAGLKLVVVDAGVLLVQVSVTVGVHEPLPLHVVLTV